MMTTQATTPPAASSEPQNELSGWQATLLVAEREIVSQVRSKAFLISTAITMLLIIGGIVLANVLTSGDDPTPVAVVGNSASAIESDDLQLISVADRAAGEELLFGEEVDAIIVPDESSTLGYRIVALSEAPVEVVAAFSLNPDIELLEPESTSDGLRAIIAIGFGLVFMIAALGSGMMIVQNTVQEKQSRIVEILLVAVRARSLMAGKIFGNSVIGVGTAVVMAAASALGLVLTGQTDLLTAISMPMIWFVIFFVFGFVLVASVFAASAALVSRQEDTGSVVTPAMMMVMLPYFGVVFFSGNSLVMTVMSYIPFSAPVAMPVRMFLGEAQWWEPLLSLGLLAACTAVVVVIAGKIYSGSLLRMGGRVTVKEALRGS